MADTKLSVMARGPTGLTTVLTGETAISAGAMLRPCIAVLTVRVYGSCIAAVWSKRMEIEDPHHVVQKTGLRVHE